MSSLEDFFTETKAGGLPEISSISTYSCYGSDVETKAISASKNTKADAYLVNFTGDNGFAVLGANTAVPSIVAVVDKGTIEDDLTVVIDGGNQQSDDAVDPQDIPSNFNGYCSEDDDYYSASDFRDMSLVSADLKFVSSLIDNAVAPRPEDVHAGGDANAPVSSGNRTVYSTVAPMLTYSWSQGDNYGQSYNKYCRRKDGMVALTGCSATAMAMIVAYNEFPQKLYLDDCDSKTPLDWGNMKSKKKDDDLNNVGKEDISRLMGSIFNHVKKICFSKKDKTPKATCITPEQIRKRMEDFGYENVTRLNGTTFTTEMKSATSEMLKEGKPVFVSAIPGAADGLDDLFKGHSWVIDGAKYSGLDYLLHFNFGWSGVCDGYFSLQCLCPGKAVEYDKDYSDEELQELSDTYDYTYSWHFRLLTYDIPSVSCIFHTTAQ